MGTINSYPEQTVVDDSDLFLLRDAATGAVKRVLFSTIKSKLKPHYNSLFFSNSGNTGGQVVAASEAVIGFDASDTANDNGITATTGASAYLQIARDSVYQISATMNASDGAASTTFILWFEVSTDNGASWIRFRQSDRTLSPGQGQMYSMVCALEAGDRVRLKAYNTGGNIRLACDTESASLLERMFAGPKLSVTELS